MANRLNERTTDNVTKTDGELLTKLVRTVERKSDFLCLYIFFINNQITLKNPNKSYNWFLSDIYTL